MSSIGNSNQLLHGRNISHQNTYQTARSLRDVFVEEPEMMALWTEEIYLIDCCVVYEPEDKHEDRLIENELLNSYVPGA